MDNDERKRLEEITRDVAVCPDPDIRWLIALAEREAKRADQTQKSAVPKEILAIALDERDAARALCREAAEAIRALPTKELYPRDHLALLARLDEVGR